MCLVMLHCREHAMYRGAYITGRGLLTVARRACPLSTASRPPRPAPVVEVTPELRKKNILTALGCLAFVGGVYTYSIRKLQDEDMTELEEMTVVNMHESGLKATKFKGLLEESKEEEARIQEAFEDGKAEIPLAAEEGAKKGGGWKRWVMFWKKSE